MLVTKETILFFFTAQVDQLTHAWILSLCGRGVHTAESKGGILHFTLKNTF